MHKMRPYIALLFAAMLVVTSQSMAVARGMTRDAAGAMILCTGSGSVTVYYDENGEPIGPSHICPDCAIGFADAVDAEVVLPAPLFVARDVEIVHVARVFWIAPAQAPNARGPPVV